MPAFTLKLNYKVANGDKGDDLASSGSDDHGYMMTFSKGFDPWFVYFAQGMTNFGRTLLASDLSFIALSF